MSILSISVPHTRGCIGIDQRFNCLSKGTWKRRDLGRTSACVFQETLDTLRQAMRNTRILCAVMLDTKVQSRS